MHNTATYVLTYNCPLQLEYFLRKLREHQPSFLTLSDFFVCDQSDAEFHADYKRLCVDFGINHWPTTNDGYTGGRLKCAAHFKEREKYTHMWYFEDDHIFKEPGAPRNNIGFPGYVQNVFEKGLAIVKENKLDYLKLNFNEVYTDHIIYFPIDRADHKYARYEKLAYAGVGYLVGEVFYCNWPSCLSREGNAKIYFSGYKIKAESDVTNLSHVLIDKGELAAGVLMASPTTHDRRQDYNRAHRVDVRLSDSDKIDRFMSWQRVNTERLVDSVRRAMPPAAVVLDVGAGVGQFAELLVDTIAPSAVHLFEPVPALLSAAEARIKDKRCFFHPYAVSDKDENGVLLYCNTGDNIGWNSMLDSDPVLGAPLSSVPTMSQLMVQTLTLSSWLATHADVCPDLIKIDVEGLECRVLRGLLPWLERSGRRPVLVVEAAWGIHHPEWCDNEKIYACLSDLGYAVPSIGEETIDVVLVVKDARTTEGLVI